MEVMGLSGMKYLKTDSHFEREVMVAMLKAADKAQYERDRRLSNMIANEIARRFKGK